MPYSNVVCVSAQSMEDIEQCVQLILFHNLHIFPLFAGPYPIHLQVLVSTPPPPPPRSSMNNYFNVGEQPLIAHGDVL